MRVELNRKMKEIRDKIVIVAIVLLVAVLVVNSVSFLVETFNQPSDVARTEELENHYNTAYFGDKEIPKDKVDEVVSFIDTFIQTCNNNDWDNAYSMLNDNYKELEITKEEFKGLYERRFSRKQSYSYQNLTNIENAYVYQIRLYDDLMLYANNEYENNNETKILVTVMNENGELSLSLDGFIGKFEINKSIENEYLKIVMNYKIVRYDRVSYNMEITNVSNKVLSLYDTSFGIQTQNTKTEKILNYKPISTNIGSAPNVISPENTRTLTYTYAMYSDIPNTVDYRFILNKVYVFEPEEIVKAMMTTEESLENTQKVLYNIYIEMN